MTTTPAPGDAGSGFTELGRRSELLTTLTGLGYEEPTPIQQEGGATGTGKTAAYALPVLQRLPDGRNTPDPAALVLVPTRELAIQVSEAMYRYGRCPARGSSPSNLRRPAVRTAAPGTGRRGGRGDRHAGGRALDHLRRGTVLLGQVAAVVLDEADEMLDLGFVEDLEAILAETPNERQTVLFSATMPRRLDALARRHLRDLLVIVA